MASTQVVETSVNTNNSPQDYTTNPDDHSNRQHWLTWVQTFHCYNSVITAIFLLQMFMKLNMHTDPKLSLIT